MIAVRLSIMAVPAADGAATKPSQNREAQGLAVDYPSWFRWCDWLFGDS
jgi:hypothetical protein